MSRENRKTTVVCGVLAVILAGVLAACILPPPPPFPGHHVTVVAEGPVLPLPPPPPFVLPPAPVVVYNGTVGCDYVEGVDYDVFYVNGYFYTHHNHRWFCAPRPAAVWVVVEPAYVPRMLVAGPPPPGWNRAPAGPRRTITSFRNDLPFPAPASSAAKSAVRSRADQPAPRAATLSSRGQIEQPAAAISPSSAAVRKSGAASSGRVKAQPHALLSPGDTKTATSQVSPVPATLKPAPTPKPTPTPAPDKKGPKTGRAPGPPR